MFILCLIPSDLFSHPSNVPLLILPLLCSCTARFRPRAVKVWGPTWAHKFWKSTTDLKVLGARVATQSKFQTEDPEILTLILLIWSIGWAPNNVSKWQMGFNSAFKGLSATVKNLVLLATWLLGFVDPPTQYFAWASGPGSTKQWWNLYDFLNCRRHKHLPARPQTSYWLYQPKLLIRHLLIGWRWRVKSSRRLRFPGCWCEWWAGRHVRRRVTARISYAALISGIKYQHGLRDIYIYIYIYIYYCKP